MTRGTVIDYDSGDEPLIVTPQTANERYWAKNGARVSTAGEIKALAQHSSKSVEHYTPSWILDGARKLLGGEFDLDPATSWLANETVRAERWYGVHDDGSMTNGLRTNWPASQRVWLNPPGGHTRDHDPALSSICESYATLWWGKLVDEYMTGNIKSACYLSFSYNLMQMAQQIPIAHPTTYPIVYFKDRTKYNYPMFVRDGRPVASGLSEGKQPPAAGFLVWLPPLHRELIVDAKIEMLRDAFGEYGVCKV